LLTLNFRKIASFVFTFCFYQIPGLTPGIWCFNVWLRSMYHKAQDGELDKGATIKKFLIVQNRDTSAQVVAG